MRRMPKTGILAGFFIVLVFAASLQLQSRAPAVEIRSSGGVPVWSGYFERESLVTWETDERLAVINKEGSALRVRRYNSKGLPQGENLVNSEVAGQVQAAGGGLVNLGVDGNITRYSTRGNRLWSRAFSAPARILDLCGGEGVLLAVRHQGGQTIETLYFLDGAGQTLWTFGPVAGVFTAGSGAPAEGAVAAAWVTARGGTGAEMAILDRSGKVVWKRDYPEPIHRLQVGAGGIVGLATGNRVEALEPGGEQLFTWEALGLPTGIFRLKNRFGVLYGDRFTVLDLAGRQVGSLPLGGIPLRAELNPSQEAMAVLDEQGRLAVHQLDH